MRTGVLEKGWLAGIGRKEGLRQRDCINNKIFSSILACGQQRRIRDKN